MSKIIRVFYEHSERQNVKNTFVDFKLLPNQEKILYVEIREIIPEHTNLISKLINSEDESI